VARRLMAIVMSNERKYILIGAIGLLGGFLGEEIGVRIIALLPARIWGESVVIDFLPFVASFVPFILIAAAFVITTQRYRSFLSGVVLSAAYYLPFQYKNVLASKTAEDTKVLTSLGEVLVIFVAVTLILTAIYSLIIKTVNYKDRRIST
jgi:hypothetical protein